MNRLGRMLLLDVAAILLPAPGTARAGVVSGVLGPTAENLQQCKIADLARHRLQILSPEEYQLLWVVPRFSQYDRDLFFALTARERHTLARLRTARTKVHFLLQLGYFRARQRFFRVEAESIRDDVEYLSRRYLDNAVVADFRVSDHSRRHHVALILGLFRYRLCERDLRLQLEERALSAARISSRPV